VAKTRTGAAPDARRARPRRAYWQALIAECGRSGLSQAEFCRRRRIVPGTLAFWKHTLAREAEITRPGATAPTAAPPMFVPVRVMSRPAPVERPADGATAPRGELEIVLDGRRRVRVRGPVDVQWLGQVLRMVETLEC
jgi:hypothetical protein